MLKWFILVAALIAFTGCAQPQPPKKYHAQNTKSDFGSRLDIIVNYHLTSDSAIIVVDISNPRANNYRYWLVQISATDGQVISASRRVFTGTDKTKQLIFTLPLPIEGVEETFFIEVFDEKGARIMKSDPINNKPTEG